GSVCADFLDVALDLLVESGDKRGDQHDDAYTKHDAEYGERTAHLMRTKGVHSLAEVFAVLLGHGCLSLPPAALRWDRAWRRESRDRCRRKGRRPWKPRAKESRS